MNTAHMHVRAHMYTIVEGRSDTHMKRSNTLSFAVVILSNRIMNFRDIFQEGEKGNEVATV